jgi:hypothetical protein
VVIFGNDDVHPASADRLQKRKDQRTKSTASRTTWYNDGTSGMSAGRRAPCPACTLYAPRDQHILRAKMSRQNRSPVPLAARACTTLTKSTHADRLLALLSRDGLPDDNEGWRPARHQNLLVPPPRQLNPSDLSGTVCRQKDPAGMRWLDGCSEMTTSAYAGAERDFENFVVAPEFIVATA